MRVMGNNQKVPYTVGSGSYKKVFSEDFTESDVIGCTKQRICIAYYGRCYGFDETVSESASECLGKEIITGILL